MPQISVIVPVYKVEPYLHRCVDSILGQTFSDFELILIDDGSPDNCGAICDEYIECDCRVRVFHRENQGVSAARNFGIDWVTQNSDSQWVMFVDSDDWMHPKLLECLVNAATRYDVSISVCGYVNTIGEVPDVDCMNITARKITVEQFYVNTEKNSNFVVPWGKLYRKDVFGDIRYPIGKRFEDEFTTYKILFPCKELAFVDAPLYNYFQNTSSFMHESWTPSRLIAIEAMAEQVRYLNDWGYVEGYRCAVRKYILVLGYHLTSLKKCDLEVRKEYIPLLRGKLKKALLKRPKAMQFEGNQWLYELAFPNLMQLYWVVKAQICKLKQK